MHSLYRIVVRASQYVLSAVAKVDGGDSIVSVGI